MVLRFPWRGSTKEGACATISLTARHPRYFSKGSNRCPGEKPKGQMNRNTTYPSRVRHYHARIDRTSHQLRQDSRPPITPTLARTRAAIHAGWQLPHSFPPLEAPPFHPCTPCSAAPSQSVPRRALPLSPANGPPQLRGSTTEATAAAAAASAADWRCRHCPTAAPCHNGSASPAPQPRRASYSRGRTPASTGGAADRRRCCRHRRCRHRAPPTPPPPRATTNRRAAAARRWPCVTGGGGASATTTAVAPAVATTSAAAATTATAGRQLRAGDQSLPLPPPPPPPLPPPPVRPAAAASRPSPVGRRGGAVMALRWGQMVADTGRRAPGGGEALLAQTFAYQVRFVR